MTLDYIFTQPTEFDLPFYEVTSNDVFFPDSGKISKTIIGHISYSLKSKKWKFVALQGVWYGDEPIREIANKLDELNANTAKQRIFGFI